MSLSYNLVDKPFIPCLMADGSSVELGLKETLRRAHEIREVRDQSPLVTITLHRLLLAILHRNFGPATLRQWNQLLEAGRFNACDLDPYFDQWKDRFDLFNDNRPFYQIGGMTTEKPLPVAALFDELACNNNPTLFDHTANEPPKEVTFAVAARGLIARQGFALGLGVSPDVTICGRVIKTGNRSDGPLARGLLLLLRGQNLFETLLCNLSVDVPTKEDLPVWEQQDSEGLMGNRRPLGRLDLYTWQSRRLRLVPPEPGDDSDVVSKVHFAQGREVDKEEMDPMKPYRRDERRGWLVFSIDPDRGMWRDSAALLQLAHDPDRSVPALNWVARATLDGSLPHEKVYSLDAFGVGTQVGKATSVILWRHDRVPIPVKYLNSPELVTTLQTAFKMADEMASALSRSLAPSAGETTKDEGRILETMAKRSPKAIYWSRLEIPFRRFLLVLPGDEEHRVRELAQWVCGTLRTEARRAFVQTIGELDRSARILKAVVRARQKLQTQLNILCKPFKESLHEQSC